MDLDISDPRDLGTWFGIINNAGWTDDELFLLARIENMFIAGAPS